MARIGACDLDQRKGRIKMFSATHAFLRHANDYDQSDSAAFLYDAGK